MSEKENTNLLYAIQALGAELAEKDMRIRAKEYRIETLEKEVAEQARMIAAERIKNGEEEATVSEKDAYIAHLLAKICELEERVAIMTESEAPCPVWDITPPAKEVTEVTNVTKVIEGGEEV